MSCTTGKVVYSSERAAKRALRAIPHPHGKMHAYLCGGHWYLGHNDRVDRNKQVRR